VGIVLDEGTMRIGSLFGGRRELSDEAKGIERVQNVRLSKFNGEEGFRGRGRKEKEGGRGREQDESEQDKGKIVSKPFQVDVSCSPAERGKIRSKDNDRNGATRENSPRKPK